MALDLDPDRVRQAAAAGHSVVFGDAARLQALMAAGLHRAMDLDRHAAAFLGRNHAVDFIDALLRRQRGLRAQQNRSSKQQFRQHGRPDYSPEWGGKKTGLDGQLYPDWHVIRGLFCRAAHLPVDAAFFQPIGGLGRQ